MLAFCPSAPPTKSPARARVITTASRPVRALPSFQKRPPRGTFEALDENAAAFQLGIGQEDDEGERIAAGVLR
jgi:hypothetical protein